tara:strand:- start:37 stop:210 length:174 start_codon:yes stop_codon:yes gene_type:complete
VKSADWIEELYFKELIYKNIKEERAHDKDRTIKQKNKGTSTRNRSFSKQVHSPTTDY